MKPWTYLFGLFLVCTTALLANPKSASLGSRLPANSTTSWIELKTDMLPAGDFNLFILTDQSGDIEGAHAAGPGFDTSWDITHVRAGISIPLATPFGKFGHIVTIKAENLDARNGGILTLTFPHNVLLGEYMSKTVHVVRDETGWHAISDQSLGNRAFHTLFLKGNFIPMAKVPVGVADISILN